MVKKNNYAALVDAIFLKHSANLSAILKKIKERKALKVSAKFSLHATFLGGGGPYPHAKGFTFTHFKQYCIKKVPRLIKLSGCAMDYAPARHILFVSDHERFDKVVRQAARICSADYRLSSSINLDLEIDQGIINNNYDVPAMLIIYVSDSVGHGNTLVNRLKESRRMDSILFGMVKPIDSKPIRLEEDLKPKSHFGKKFAYREKRNLTKFLILNFLTTSYKFFHSIFCSTEHGELGD